MADTDQSALSLSAQAWPIKYVGSIQIWYYIRHFFFMAQTSLKDTWLHKAIHIARQPLNCQSQQLSSALSSACDFRSHFGKQCEPRSDCSSRSSLIWVHAVCQHAKIGLKSLQEYSAEDINRRHFQMQVFLAF